MRVPGPFQQGFGGSPLDRRYALAGATWSLIGTTAAPFFNNYNSYASASPLYTCAYSKDGLGFVHLRGLTGNSAAWTTGVMFTLPGGYASTQEEYFSAVAFNNVGALLGTAMLNTTAGLARLSLAVVPATATWSTTAFISLSGITWYAGL